MHTSSSSSTGHSSLHIASDSSLHSSRTERSDTLKPARTPRTPRPGQILTQVFQDQSSHSLTSAGAGSSSYPNTPVGGLRAQLHQLLPRHTLFHVRVNIHQLSSVPLVKGQFGVRWKFKNVKSRKEKEKHSKGKAKTEESHANSDDGEEHGSGDVDRASVEGSMDDTHGSHVHLTIPSVLISDGYHSTPPSATSTRSASPNPYSQYLTSDWLPPSSLPFNSTRLDSSLSSTTSYYRYAPARGMTPYLKLRDHNVVWEHTLNVVVRIDVDRDTMDLLPNELKLVVMQRVISGDIDAPHNPRLGAIYLNLAEYANAGPVTRQYLLSESKTNATMKLTIQLERVGGEEIFKAPPLPKDGVLGGITGILENDVYRTHPRKLDLYGMYYDNEGKGDKHRKGATLNLGADTFDMSNLSSSYGPRTTETLIEAIFNPVPTHSEKESPFTYYVPLEREKKSFPLGLGLDTNDNGSGSLNPHEKDGSMRSTATISSSYASVRSNSSSGKAPSLSSRSGRSVSSHDRSSEFGGRGTEEEKTRHWWHRIGHSRPGTPII